MHHAATYDLREYYSTQAIVVVVELFEKTRSNNVLQYCNWLEEFNYFDSGRLIRVFYPLLYHCLINTLLDLWHLRV